MENAVRSERSRATILQAALTVIARDGANRMTLDAIAREAGISKGGVMHQFRSKDAVLRALMQQQMEEFEAFSCAFLARRDPDAPEPTLAAMLATMRAATGKPTSAAYAILGALAEDPALLSVLREKDAKKIAKIKAEAADPEEALLRWAAGRGLMFSSMLGLCPLSPRERAALFDRLDEDNSKLASKRKPK